MRIEGTIIRKGEDKRYGLIRTDEGRLFSLPVIMYLTCVGNTETPEERDLFFKGYHGFPAELKTEGRFNLLKGGNLTRILDAHRRGILAAVKVKNTQGRVAMDFPEELPEQGVFD